MIALPISNVTGGKIEPANRIGIFLKDLPRPWTRREDCAKKDELKWLRLVSPIHR